MNYIVIAKSLVYQVAYVDYADTRTVQKELNLNAVNDATVMQCNH